MSTKIKISMKDTKNFKKVWACGYMDLTYIMDGIQPQFYNCGVYGWNCDIYVDYKTDQCFTTGYRNMRGQQIPYNILKKFDKKAREICDKFIDWQKREKALKKNREKFIETLNNLEI